MKKLLAVILLSTFLYNVFAEENLSTVLKMLDNKEYTDVIVIITERESINVNLLRGIIINSNENHSIEIFKLLKSNQIFHDYDGWWLFNPLICAISHQKINLSIELLRIIPDLINKPEDSGKSYVSLYPIIFAVLSDNTDLVSLMISLGAKTDMTEWLYTSTPSTYDLESPHKNIEPLNLPLTIFCFSQSKKMTNTLLQLGVPKNISWRNTGLYNKAIINDDNVRFRSESSIDSSVLRKFSKGEEVELLEINTVPEIINNQSSNWLKAKDSKGIIGWVFGAFVENTNWKDL